MALTLNPKSELWSHKVERDKTTGTTVYQIISDTPTTPAAASAYALSQTIGNLGNVYPGEPNTSSLRAISRDCKPQGPTRTIFLLTIEHDSTIAYSPNPLDDEIAIDFDGENADEAYFQDTQDDPKYAETTAGEPFKELPRRENNTVVINYSRNVPATASYATYYALANKVNEGTVTIAGIPFDDGQVKHGVPKLSAIQDRDGQKYRVLTGQVKARADGWDDKYESRGLFEWDDALSILLPIVDSQGVVTTAPWPLDADGAAKGSLDETGAEIKLEPYVRADLAPIFAPTEA